VIHDPPTAEDIAKATTPIRDQLIAVTKERDVAVSDAATARRQLEGRTTTAPANPQPPLGLRDVAIKLDIWQTVLQAHIRNFVDIYNNVDRLQSVWRDAVPQNRVGLLTEIRSWKEKILGASTKLEGLRLQYTNYSDVSEALKQTRTDELVKAIGYFQKSIEALPDRLPPDWEQEVRQFSGTLRQALTDLLNWESTLQKTAQQNQQILLGQKQ
jgi:hypothetical protein